MSSTTPHDGMILVEAPSHQRKKLSVILFTLVRAEVGLFDNGEGAIGHVDRS